MLENSGTVGKYSGVVQRPLFLDRFELENFSSRTALIVSTTILKQNEKVKE
jgi:hypothetical protein